MSEPELRDTQPNLTTTKLVPGTSPSDPRKKFPRWLVALIVVALIALGLLGGYGSGMGQRYAAQNTVVSGQLDEQFQLGTEAYAAGNYVLAEQYFKFIIAKDSNYPGIQAAYTDTLLHLQATPTPVFSPTPVMTPTPDLRGVLEIFNSALQLLNAGDWNAAITNLDSLRKADSTYRTAEVDGMYYMALRQLGVEKINSGCQNVNLEAGIYYLTLAEHFVGTGNLDSVAEGLRTYARLYIIGASFWDQDWLQAQNFFSQVMAAYPNMTDSSCLSATSRWVLATHKVAEQLFAAGSFCAAEEQYATAFMVGDPYNATAYPTATMVSDTCNGGPRNNNGGSGGNPTATPTFSGTPTETPTGAPTEVPTEVPPTETPTTTSGTPSGS
jgi:tetratricopeptide (TPR) repeat protein